MIHKEKHHHTDTEIAKIASLFFMVRGVVRTSLAQGKKLNPSAWLHIETLIFIRDHEGPLMREVAEHLSITAPSATSLITALAKNGLVRKQQDKNDARASRLFLTKKGEKMLAVAQARGHAALGEVFSSLSASELASLSKLLGKVLADKTCGS